MSSLLAVEKLVVGYGSPVVGPLSFELHPGETVGVWGPNGSGKSTLLRAVVDAVRIFNGRIDRRPGLRLAYLQQQPVRLPEMPIRGEEFLQFMHAQHAEPPPRLADWLPQRIDRLSGGQFQLLCIWACLASDTDLVLLDEPTNNLDPESTSTLAHILRDQAGIRTVLVVSHDREFMTEVCTRVVEVRRWI